MEKKAARSTCRMGPPPQVDHLAKEMLIANQSITVEMPTCDHSQAGSVVVEGPAVPDAFMAADARYTQSISRQA